MNVLLGKISHKIIFNIELKRPSVGPRVPHLHVSVGDTLAASSVHATVFVCVADQEEADALMEKKNYRKTCERLHVAPASHFLENMQKSDLSMKHYGLGPQVLKYSQGL